MIEFSLCDIYFFDSIHGLVFHFAGRETKLFIRFDIGDKLNLGVFPLKLLL